MELLAWISGLAAGVAIMAFLSVIQSRRQRKALQEVANQLHEVVETHRGDDLYLQQEILTWSELQERLKDGTAIGLQMDYREIKRRIGA